MYSPAGGRDVVKLLVGNKIDKVRVGGWVGGYHERARTDAGRALSCGLQERVVSRREAEEWARSKGMLFVESSAKTKIGIQQVFNEVVQKVGLSLSSVTLFVLCGTCMCLRR